MPIGVPSGRLRRGIIGVERSFTGQQKDFSSGLIYMNARYYDRSAETSASSVEPLTSKPRTWASSSGAY